MTEDEAKQKMCCGSPMIGGVMHQIREAKKKRLPLTCVASSCMAWRWAGYRAKDGTWVRKTADGPWKPENADGFCGLASQPQ